MELVELTFIQQKKGVLKFPEIEDDNGNLPITSKQDFMRRALMKGLEQLITSNQK